MCDMSRKLKRHKWAISATHLHTPRAEWWKERKWHRCFCGEFGGKRANFVATEARCCGLDWIREADTASTICESKNWSDAAKRLKKAGEKMRREGAGVLLVLLLLCGLVVRELFLLCQLPKVWMPEVKQMISKIIFKSHFEMVKWKCSNYFCNLWFDHVIHSHRHSYIIPTCPKTTLVNQKRRWEMAKKTRMGRERMRWGWNLPQWCRRRAPQTRAPLPATSALRSASLQMSPDSLTFSTSLWGQSWTTGPGLPWPMQGWLWQWREARLVEKSIWKRRWSVWWVGRCHKAANLLMGSPCTFSCWPPGRLAPPSWPSWSPTTRAPFSPLSRWCTSKAMEPLSRLEHSTPFRFCAVSSPATTQRAALPMLCSASSASQDTRSGLSTTSVWETCARALQRRTIFASVLTSWPRRASSTQPTWSRLWGWGWCRQNLCFKSHMTSTSKS